MVDLAVAYTKEREAFGKAIFDFRNTKFKLAETKTEVLVARTYLDRCIAEHAAGHL